MKCKFSNFKTAWAITACSHLCHGIIKTPSQSRETIPLMGEYHEIFNPQFFLANNTPWVTGPKIFLNWVSISEIFTKMCQLRTMPHSTESRLPTMLHSGELSLPLFCTVEVNSALWGIAGVMTKIVG
jgi:hypothetical protein